MGGWWRYALLSPDGVAPSQMVGVSASVNVPLHDKVHKFSSGTSSPGWSRKKGRKTVVVVALVVVEWRFISLIFTIQRVLIALYPGQRECADMRETFTLSLHIFVGITQYL